MRSVAGTHKCLSRQAGEAESFNGAVGETRALESAGGGFIGVASTKGMSYRAGCVGVTYAGVGEAVGADEGRASI